MPLWKIQVGDQFSPAIFEALAARGVVRLPDEPDGEGTPMRVLQATAPSREDALDLVCEVLDEHSYMYSYFNVTPADAALRHEEQCGPRSAKLLLGSQAIAPRLDFNPSHSEVLVESNDTMRVAVDRLHVEAAAEGVRLMRRRVNALSFTSDHPW